MPGFLFTDARPHSRRSLVWAGGVLITSALAFNVVVRAQSPAAHDAGVTLARLGDYVEQYYSRAQSVVAEEVVAIQSLNADMTPKGFPRRLVYELRIEWSPSSTGGAPTATVVRELLKVGSRPARLDEKPECLDMRAVSPEPLAILLPGKRDRFVFTTAGEGRVARRAAIMVDYAPVFREPPQTTWRDECVSIDLPGHTRGRVWMDPVTAEVLRLDERVVGSVDIPVPSKLQRGGPLFMTIERADTSIRYRAVTFTDPDETLLLPSQIDSLTIVRNSGSPRVRMTQTFGKYRRFLTGSRLVR